MSILGIRRGLISCLSGFLVLTAAQILTAQTDLGPGVAGQVHAAAYDPLDEDTIYAGCDVAGVLVTHDHGRNWESWNQGLENTEWAATEYVDGLAVVKSNSPAYPVPAARQGVYAATHGGIYFRPTNGTWQLQTNYAASDTFRYTGYFLTRSPGTPGLYAPVPFSCLALDGTNGVLYAGAGHGRWYDSAAKWDAFYPDSCATMATFSLWRCDLSGSGDGLWHPILATENQGKVRQIAILGSGTAARPVFASNKGVYAINASSGVCENLWETRDKTLAAGFEWPGTAWGVGVGKNGILYTVMAAGFDFGTPPVRSSNPNVYKLDTTLSSAAWEPICSMEESVWPDIGASPNTWGQVVTNANCNLMRLTVVPGDSATPDAVYVGERRSTANSGYLRHGAYFASAGLDTGWVRVLYLTNAAGGGVVWDDVKYHAVNLFANPVSSSELTDVGWASNETITPTIPLLLCPTRPDRMFAFAYHLPLAFDSPASGWQQRNCTGTGSGPDGLWRSNGLNEMSVAALGFAPSHRLMVGSLDFGAFVTPSTDQSEFQWLNWYADGPRNVQDVEALPASGSTPERILAVRAAPRKWINGHGTSHFGFRFEPATSSNRGTWQDFVLARYDESISGAQADSNGYRWRYLSRGLDSAFDGLGTQPHFRVADVEVVDASTFFVACSKDLTGGSSNYASCVFKGTIDADDNVQWSRWWTANSHCQAVEMEYLPSTGRLLVAAARDSGGVFCLDVNDSTVSQRWLWKTDTNIGERMANTLRYVNCIARDKLERVVYVGTRGEYGYIPGSLSIGAVLRLTIPTGRAPNSGDWEIIANAANQNPFGFVTPTAPGFWPWPNESATPQERLTDVRDIAVDPGNPHVIYAALRQAGVISMGTFSPTNGVWKFSPAGAAGNWARVFPSSLGAEPSGGVNRIAIDPEAPSQVYLGTHGQELYKIAVSPAVHPAIATQASYALRAGAADTVVFAVRIDSPDSVVTATADLAGLGVVGAAVTLSDSGAGDDIAKGDGIFTSTRIVATLTAGANCSVRVFAQDEKGGYDQRDVTVEVIASKAKFVDGSAQTGDLNALLTAKPYSTVYFQSSPTDTTMIMVVTFDDNGTPPLLLRHWRTQERIPEFKNRGAGGPDQWLDADLPLGSRGICCADYDNDGDNDLFLCNPREGGKLYENRLNLAPPRFVNVTSAICGADSVYLDGAITASWGDYNADGFVDLFVGTTNFEDPVKALDPNAMGTFEYHTRVFKSACGKALKKTWWGENGINNICLAGCWVDLDNDGDLDLVSTRFVLREIVVAENLGFNYVAMDNILSEPVQGGWSVPDEFWGANSVSPIDYDHDGYMDLLITEPCNEYRIRILRNEYGTGQSKSFEAITVDSGTLRNGSVVADFNLDGQDDFLLLPAKDNVGAELHVADGYPSTPGAHPQYRALGYALGLRDGAAGGGLAADFDGDHAPDLFLGRARTDDSGPANQFFYKNVGLAVGEASWLEVRPRTLGDSNGSLIGTKVTVSGPGQKRWTKVIDGGSGRGGQAANPLFVGLGDLTGSVSVQVEFPSGEVDEATHSFAPGTGWVVDAAAGVIEDEIGDIASQPTFRLELQPGTMDWVFGWRTSGIKGDLHRDKVQFKTAAPFGTPCYTTVGPQDWTDLVWGDQGVSNLVYKSGSYWQHELRLSGRSCLTGCLWLFKATSGAGGSGPTDTSPQARTSPITYCLPE